VVIAPLQTTMIKASITAYSMAVGGNAQVMHCWGSVLPSPDRLLIPRST